MAKLSQKLIDMIMPVMEKLTPSCEIISEKISQSMDHQVSLQDRIEIRIHTMGCALCERYRRQLLAMRQIVKKYANDTEKDDPEQKNRLSEEARTRLMNIVKQEKGK